MIELVHALLYLSSDLTHSQHTSQSHNIYQTFSTTHIPSTPMLTSPNLSISLSTIHNFTTTSPILPIPLCSSHNLSVPLQTIPNFTQAYSTNHSQPYPSAPNPYALLYTSPTDTQLYPPLLNQPLLTSSNLSQPHPSPMNFSIPLQTIPIFTQANSTNLSPPHPSPPFPQGYLLSRQIIDDPKFVLQR